MASVVSRLVRNLILATTAILLGLALAGALTLLQRGTPVIAQPPPTDVTSQIAKDTIPDIELRDASGSVTSLESLRAKNRLLAMVFVGCDCPLVRLYAQTLNDIHAEFAAQGVAVLGINSNVQDTMSTISQFIESERVQFQILKDVGNVVADHFGAERTPEAFLINSQGKILYRGRIDDRFGVGYRKPAASKHYLRDAIALALEGRSSTVRQTEAVGCLIGRATKPDPTGSITYSNQIARLFQKRCVECHREGEIAPFSLTSYEQAYGWAEMIREVVEQGRMPPWFASGELGHFTNDSRMTSEEREMLFEWVDNGCPEGDPKDLPPPAQFLTGWNIGEPDVVYKIADKPVKVPAVGPYDYQTFYIETGLDEDQWIVAAEARPGNRKVVHHVAIWILRDGMPRDDYSTSPPISFAPGMPALSYPEGTALLLPKKSVLRYQIHYEPCGYETEDLSSVGFVFCPPSEVKSQVLFDAVFPNDPIQIPPGAASAKLDGYFYFAREATLFGLMPHMHLRGKSFRYVLLYPDQSRKVLLDIPRWDFGWQFWYLLPTPLSIPAGATLMTESIFDNSVENPANPDVTQTVTWGPKTSDEMTVGIFAAIDPLSQKVNPASEYFPPREGFNALPVSEWKLKNHAGGTGRLVAGQNPYSTQEIAIEQASDKAWKVQLARPVAKLTKGHSYCLSFRARSSETRPISFGVCQSVPPFSSVGLFKTVEIGPEQKYLRYEFYATEDAAEAEIRFDLAAADGEVELDSVVLLQGFHR